MSPTSDIQGSLLDFALSCGIGVTVFRAGTSTTDTPFVYCMGLIFKKGQDYKIVAYDLLSGNVSTNRKPQNISEWVGWVNLVTNTDLQTEQYMIPQPTPGNIFKAFDIWGCRLYKSGKIVTLRLNCGCEMVASSDEHILFNLPEKYKPADDNIIINYITQKGLNMMISIKNNGEFRLFNNNQTVPKNDWLLRQCITYVTN